MFFLIIKNKNEKTHKEKIKWFSFQWFLFFLIFSFLFLPLSKLNLNFNRFKENISRLISTQFFFLSFFEFLRNVENYLKESHSKERSNIQVLLTSSSYKFMFQWVFTSFFFSVLSNIKLDGCVLLSKHKVFLFVYFKKGG